ncbi:FAD-binding oxidoreductase [Liquorilactobacillus oeni]|uniref:FAD FMN-containing dehydrogenase n=1 Tax=Liquorilactobacillus oeni DSM 19972 TaxID=1423777 RepID=A0A0R1MJA2_9LACO|nr:FAD-binding oxidoreductase [Liquorilactobacillus oeni]KRL05429.1 FAD FMN-containing dehydrogenase [Liquorilactobacillus oeni DSM 19972]
MTIKIEKLTIPDGKIERELTVRKKYGQNRYTQEIITGNLPAAVVHAESIADVQATLRFANQHGAAVTAFGAGTSIVNGSAGEQEGLVLDLSALNKIVEISIPDQYAIVQAGVLNGDLDEEVRKEGYFFAPDPGSKPISSVGGNIATNAGGMSSLKYGTTKQSVIGLKVVLADGTLVETGSKCFKDNVGYDLTDLFVGSEGTLGIIVEATVRILPIPFGTPTTGLATFSSMKSLSVAVEKISTSGLSPSLMEALNNTSIEALDKLEKTDLGKGGAEALLIFQLDVTPVGAIEALKKILHENNALHVSVTNERDYAQKIIKIRQDYYQAEAAYGRLVVEDVAVPLSKLPELAEFVDQLTFKTPVKAFLGGHAGDGNFHPNIAIPRELTAIPSDVTEAIKKIFAYVQSLGGTISAEHGIGDLKDAWVLPQLGQNLVDLQKKVKKTFDPNNILNPNRKV